MTPENERTKIRGSMNLAARGLLVAIMALTTAFLPPTAQAKGKPQESTQIFEHTYDEVFQAAQDATERMGMFVKAKDKGKGTISGDGHYKEQKSAMMVVNTPMTFDIHVETVSAKPETRVTVEATRHGGLGGSGLARDFGRDFLSEVQKVLATYH